MELQQMMIHEVKENQAMVVGVRGEMIAIPLASIITIEKIQTSEISLVESEDVIYLRGQVIPLVYMEKLFCLDETNEPKKDTITAVICMHNETYVGFVVDELFGQMEIESKSLGVLDNNPLFSGATILSDDQVALILDVQAIVA